MFLLLFTSPRKIDARVNAGFLHKDLFAKRALCHGTTRTSHVVWPNGPDNWADAGAQIPEHGQVVFGGFGGRKHVQLLLSNIESTTHSKD